MDRPDYVVDAEGIVTGLDATVTDGAGGGGGHRLDAEELRSAWEAALAERQEACVMEIGAFSNWQRAQARHVAACRRERLAFVTLVNEL